MESPGAIELLRLLGLAKRAGAVAAGTHRTREALDSKAAKLVLVASDASLVQLKKIEGTIRRAAVPRVVLGDRTSLGAAVGAPPLSAVAVTDARFADEMLRRVAHAAPTER